LGIIELEGTGTGNERVGMSGTERMMKRMRFALLGYRGIPLSGGELGK
jgi:hypothetical protein